MSAPSGLATVCALNVEGSEGCIYKYYYAERPTMINFFAGNLLRVLYRSQASQL
jgi:hypothetical protein